MDDLLIRCSALGYIVGKGKDRAGLTDSQTIDLKALFEKEKTLKLTEKQTEQLSTLLQKDKDSTITATQAKQLEKLILKQNSPKLTEKQAAKKLELIAKRDYKPEFDLSQTAKSYIRGIVKGVVYGTKKNIQTKPMKKGDIVECDSINLLNEVDFKRYVKNEASKKNEWIKGTCDIDDIIESLISDIKSSWSLDTFPVLPDEIDTGTLFVNEWQLRGYMMLYNRNKAEVVYCMVDTPDELLTEYDNLSIHHVSHIEPELRVTRVCFDRCEEKEELIKYKVGEARKYANWYSEQISKKYG